MYPQISLYKQPMHLVNISACISFCMYFSGTGVTKKIFSGSWKSPFSFLIPEVNPFSGFIFWVYSLTFQGQMIELGYYVYKDRFCSLFLDKMNLYSGSSYLYSGKQNNETLPVLILLLRVLRFRSRIILLSFWIKEAFFSVLVSIILPLWEVKHRTFSELLSFFLVLNVKLQTCLFLQSRWKLSDLSPQQPTEGQEKLGPGLHQFILESFHLP